MKVIAVINQKGGVGKTTTVLNLGAGLVLKGYRVLLVDLDVQGNLTTATDIQAIERTSFDILTKEAAVKEAIVKTNQADLIPYSPRLAGIDLTLAEAVAREYRLREALEEVKKLYDFVIIDTPPAINTLTLNALVSANEVIIPAQAEVFALRGIEGFMQTLEQVKTYYNKGLKVNGILLTRFNAAASLRQTITERLEDVARKHKTKIYKTRIRENVAICEAQATRNNLFSYAPKSKGALDYMSLVEEVL